MNSKVVINIVSLIIAIVGVILAIGDKLTDIPGLPGWLVSSWPFVFFLATIINRIGAAILAWNANRLSVLLVFSVLCLSGCAGGTRTVESLSLGGTLEQNPATRVVTGSGQVTIVFRDGRDSKTIKTPVLR